MKRVAFYTLGCKVNQYETEAMREQFASRGYTPVGDEETADVYVINTCTVTNLADRKSRQYIRRMKAQNPKAVVAVTGCYAQIKPEELEALTEVDIVTGTGEKSKIIDYVEECLSGHKKQKHVLGYEELTEYESVGVITSMESRTRAYIKVQEGCDRFCAYCLIPFARGHVRSRAVSEVVEEAKSLVAKGFKEVVLTGINTALYGMEDGFEFDREEGEGGIFGIEILIKRLDELEGEFRIRLSSLEPAVVDAEYVKRLLKYDKLCHHLHLSIQSGSDKIIRAMNRNYTCRQYLEIVKTLKLCDANYGISTDIICGFPGEKEDDFEDSLRMVAAAGFCRVHAFRFSKRAGTAAFEMKNQVDVETKSRRVRRLIEEGERAAKNFMRSCIGTERVVILEEICEDITVGELSGKSVGASIGDDDSQSEVNGSGSGAKVLTGYTDNYVKVYVIGCEDDINSLKKVALIDEFKDGMKGEII